MHNIEWKLYFKNIVIYGKMKLDNHPLIGNEDLQNWRLKVL
jgi:hypothetical protein